MTRILFFGRVADVLGRELTLDLPAAGCTIADLRRRLAAGPGGDILLKPGVRASVDKQVVDDGAMVTETSEIAFFSLFSGG